MGGLELVLLALLALVVVGPKDLPVLLRRLGKATARVRGMANEFRASFDEMARQSELDELRREVEALRTEHMRPIGAEFDQHMRDINADMASPPPVLDTPGYPPPEAIVPAEPAAAAARAARAAPRKRAAPSKAPAKTAAKPRRKTKT
jgi:sec-independent protein translocase protein TatB